MKFLKVLVPVLLVFQIFALTENVVNASVSSFSSSLCRSISKDPLITVCLEEASDDAKFSRRLGRSFKSAVKELIQAYHSDAGEAAFVVQPEDYAEECRGYSCTSAPGDCPSCCNELGYECSN